MYGTYSVSMFNLFLVLPPLKSSSSACQDKNVNEFPLMLHLKHTIEVPFSTQRIATISENRKSCKSNGVLGVRIEEIIKQSISNDAFLYKFNMRTFYSQCSTDFSYTLLCMVKCFHPLPSFSS